MERSPKLNIDYIAKLARLDLSPSEKERFSQQLADVLKHVELLREIDLANVVPTFQTTGSTDVVREDEMDGVKVLAPGEALSNAKSKEKDLFKVPKVI